MQIYEAAERALKEIGHPAHLREIHRHITANNYFEFGAIDPIRALGVAMDRHAKGVAISRPVPPTLFYRAGPATYGLLELLDTSTNLDVDLDAEISRAAEAEALDSSLFLEQELQRWLYKNFEQTRLTALGLGPLSLFAPDEQRGKLGKFNTRVVGEIDFLLRNEAGDYVVLELKRQSDDQTIGQLCRYWGWVKDSLASNRAVHGIVLAQEITDGLRFAIKATNERIRYRKLVIETSLGPEGR